MEKLLNLDVKAVAPFLEEDELSVWLDKALVSFDTLSGRNGPGADLLGWLDLPSSIPQVLMSRIESIVKRWSNGIEVVVVIGIGGSYIGARAAIEALSHAFDFHLSGFAKPVIVYAGHNLSEEYCSELMELLEERSAACVVISKSGVTIEPAISFRLIKSHFEKKYGKQEASERIVAVTGSSGGALRSVAEKEGYTVFVIPEDIGGRYSVLTPAGLLPIALAGYDIRSFLDGAGAMEKICSARSVENPAVIYAAARNLLYSKGKKIEILATYNPKLQYFAEWWKQLFGESQGKNGKGIFPASVNLTTDLHSMGQYIQDGERIIFETILSVKNPTRSLQVPYDREDPDGLNFLAGKKLEECNKMAELGTMMAHVDGGVPNIRMEIPNLNEFNLGALFYMFEFACGISSYMMGINPFDQPGVEDYKKNMFALLDKPGFEKTTEELKKRFL